MCNPKISLVLLYEPDNPESGPLPLARTGDSQLIVAVARNAISEANAKAQAMAEVDEVIGAFESAEAERLKAILTLLLPELRLRGESSSVRLM